MLTFFAFILTIGVIVTIHEYGHFQVARWCGVRVLRFSIGFGHALWRKSFGKDKTEFVLAAIPLGGYVKMLDENELKAEREAITESVAQIHYSEAELAHAFNRQSVYKRIAIVLAGPMANLLLAIFIYWFLIMQGVTGLRPIVGEVRAGSVAEQANLITGEVIQAIDGEQIETWSEASWILLNASLKNKTVEIRTINKKNELHLHQLKLDGMGDDVEVDILKKIGVQVFRPNITPLIEKVIPDGAADKAGVITGDEIISVDGVPTNSWNQVVTIIKANPDVALRFEIQRKQDVITAIVTPISVKENNIHVGKMGAVVKVDQSKLDEFVVKQHYQAFESLGLAVSKTWTTSVFSLKMMWRMVTGQTSWKSISGPVTIASYAGQSAGIGYEAFLSFLALVSISIGILNLLPIPVLDGGHLMYYMAEIVKGSAVSEQTMLWGQKVGFALLGLLMTLAIFNDINRIIAG